MRVAADDTWSDIFSKVLTALVERGHRVRVFDDGFGFRYEVPEQPGYAAVNITEELTEFRLDDDVVFYSPIVFTPQEGKAITAMKKGVRIINCARGGLVDEQALRSALDSGHVAGAAFDVFVEEPATKNVLFGHPNVICTPHLGAATTEAQENVALQVAEQMSDYLLTGAISNAVNFPSITAEEAPKLKPFIELAEKLGSFAGQLTETGKRTQQLWLTADSMAFIARGREYRSEFHVNPSYEIQYSLKGDLNLHYRTEEGVEKIAHVPEGSCLFQPPFVPHSPRFAPDSFQLVIERARDPRAWASIEAVIRAHVDGRIRPRRVRRHQKGGEIHRHR